MNKLIIFISCLVCLAAAGHLGLERKLSWLENLRHGSQDNQMYNERILNSNAMTTNQRQRFLLDVLLQVQRPLVNGDLIEMGKILIDQPDMYTEPRDVNLLKFLQEARNQEILSRNDIYKEQNVQQIRQLVGLHRFLVLARDWSAFQRNVCYARMRVNPVMFVNALQFAVRDRADTQNLAMPAINEILPQLYYDSDVIESAQNIDWTRLVAQTTTITSKPNLLDVFGLRNLGWMRPGLLIRRQYFTPSNSLAGSGSTFGQDVVGENVVRNGYKVQVDTQEKIVIPVQGQQSGISQVSTFSDDVGLNIFWNNLITENLMQAQINGESTANGHRLGAVNRRNSIQRNEFVGNTEFNNVADEIIAQNNRQDTAEYQNQNKIGRVGFRNGITDNGNFLELRNSQRDINVDKLQQAGQQRSPDRSQGSRGGNDIWYNQDGETGPYNQERNAIRGDNREQNDKVRYGGQAFNTNNLPFTDINSPRLLQVNRRRLNELNTIADRSRNFYVENEGRKLQQEVYDDADQQVQRRRGRVLVNDVDDITRRNNGNNGRNDWEDVNRFSQPLSSRNDQERDRSKVNRQIVEYIKNISQINGKWPTIDGDRLKSGYDNLDDPKTSSERSTYNRHTDIRQQVVDDVTGERRSLGSNTNDKSPTDELRSLRNSEVIIQNLRQLVARFNIENIALVEDNFAEIQGNQYKQQQIQEELGMQQTTRNIIQDIKSTIDMLLQRNQISRDCDQVLQVVGEVLSGARLGQQQNIWQIINTQVYRNGPSTVRPISISNLRQTINQKVIVEIVQLINQYVQQLQPYNAEDLIANEIAVNGVDVDPLITYTEAVDTDLINLVDQQLLQSNGNNLQKVQKKVVAREQRLNHEPFSITYDIASQRNQRVVVRTFLGPKVGANGMPIQFNQNRQNFILLNAFVKNLEAGNNLFKVNSRDTAYTTRDVSTLSQIYRSVMMTEHQSRQTLVGSNCKFPQRLLLPRGTINGLQMQLLVVVTPATVEDRVLQELINPERLCGLGIDGINLDRLPLGFPLDREIVNLQQTAVPNMLMKTVVIQHENQVRGNRF